MEIERRFKVREEYFEELRKNPGVFLTQGYLSTDNPTVRVRLLENSKATYLTIKVPTDSMVSRHEFEYVIPHEEAKDMLELCKFKVRKIRRRVFIGSNIWEVDEFLEKHSGLWLAEIELKSETEEFSFPEWLGEEVTQNPKYTSAYLAQHAE